ncbi:hypothetical protein ABKA04_000685 [Annulohypoxylon sp. FPYF3050]
MKGVTAGDITVGYDGRAEITFGFDNKPISVSIFPRSSAPHDPHSDQKQPFLEDRLIDLLTKAAPLDFYIDEYEKIVYEALDLIYGVGKVIFTKANLPNTTTPHPLLQALLYPPILTFRLMTIGGKAAIIPINPDKGYIIYKAKFDPSAEKNLDKDESLPHYLPRQILATETLVEDVVYVTTRVLVDNKDMYCKAHRRRVLPYLEDEIMSLQKIRRALLRNGSSIRVPQILGYVKHPEVDFTVGFLREWVPGECLENIHLNEISKSRRRKWASQIRQTVDQLHEMKVIWGVGNPGNVIIDKEDNAWLININFGDGSTDWVYKQSADEKGDKKSVGKIAERLGVEGDY